MIWFNSAQVWTLAFDLKTDYVQFVFLFKSNYHHHFVLMLCVAFNETAPVYHLYNKIKLFRRIQ